MFLNGEKYTVNKVDIMEITSHDIVIVLLFNSIATDSVYIHVNLVNLKLEAGIISEKFVLFYFINKLDMEFIEV